jgi:hypothetical protein
MRNILTKFILTALLFFIPCLLGAVSAYAQPGDPGGDPDVPISGIEILIGLGGLYGASKVYLKNKRGKN